LSEHTSYFDLIGNQIGSGKAMQEIYEIIEGVAKSDANILIFGESGTGKWLIANAIHRYSLRAEKKFGVIKFSILSKERIESVLFGHTEAFAGATKERTGVIGQVNGGSLIIDEIAETPVELQTKLLQVLQERVYYPLGSEKGLEADFRLISTTNRDPSVAIRDGQLQEDFYNRINTIQIHIPPLRNRAEDIEQLAEYSLKFYAEQFQRRVHSISQPVYKRMFDYSWPGNARELQTAIKDAVHVCKGEVIEDILLGNENPFDLWKKWLEKYGEKADFG
jgi:DNA-binding NtrC family response regulator